MAFFMEIQINKDWKKQGNNNRQKNKDDGAASDQHDNSILLQGA